MQAIETKHTNFTYAKDQPPYKPLPVFRINDPNGTVVSCWKLSFKERLRMLFYGRIYLGVLTFRKPLQPVFLAVKRKEIYIHKTDKPNLIVKLKKYFTNEKNK